MRTVFFGTPEIAVPALRALAETTELAGVVSQPDRPARRGLSLKSPAVKKVAESLGKNGQGALPLTCVNTRDLHSRGQQHQEGRRDKMITNLIV